MGLVARLVPQKGLDLIKHAITHTLQAGGQFILQGSSPDPAIQADFEALKERLSDNPNVYFHLSPEEELTHQIFAGCDLFVVPSLWEPCGLTQLIAIRYGTLPVVRATGGLVDTITDGKNGFLFEEPDPEELSEALDRALTLWATKPKKWKEMMSFAMRQDFSWEKPAADFLRIYKRARDALAQPIEST